MKYSDSQIPEVMNGVFLKRFFEAFVQIVSKGARVTIKSYLDHANFERYRASGFRNQCSIKNRQRNFEMMKQAVQEEDYGMLRFLLQENAK